jgi:uncharacterized protein with HEPN domain
MPKDKAAVHDILESMRMVVGYLQGRAFEDFSRDQACIDAVVRRLEIIGEAVKRLFAELRGLHPQIPWQKMAGMRDRLIHGYDDIDLDDVFNAVTQIIPPLIPQLEAINSSLPDPI